MDEEKNNVWDAIYDDRSPAFLLVGYGATRRVEDSKNFDTGARHKSRHLRYQRVASLFEDHVSLTPLNAWLPKLKESNKGRYTQVVHLIDRLLPAPFSFDGTVEDGEYQFYQDSNPVLFPALSDGYKAYLGWITDLLYHVCMGCPTGKKLVENKGVVLVDEIDLHLHPGWQRVVVPMISRALPNLQFVLTSHSPLVTGSLQRANLFVLTQDGNGTVSVQQLDEQVHGMTSEQVLLSSYFNLGSTRATSVTDEIAGLVSSANLENGSAALEAMKTLALAGTGGTNVGKRAPKLRKSARPRIPLKSASTTKAGKNTGK
ncbi:MAG: AAA family ATPase [Verrucomicrobiales bacterium]